MILDYYVKRSRGIKVHHSLIHFIGPIFFLTGFALLPLQLSPFFWLCVFLDPTVLFIPPAIIALIKGLRS